MAAPPIMTSVGAGHSVTRYRSNGSFRSDDRLDGLWAYGILDFSHGSLPPMSVGPSSVVETFFFCWLAVPVSCLGHAVYNC